jgi:hypothetical protein
MVETASAALPNIPLASAPFVLSLSYQGKTSIAHEGGERRADEGH